MVSGLIFLVVAVLVVVLLGFVKFSHMKHKLNTLFLVGLLIFFVVTGAIVFNGKSVDYSSPNGIFEAGKLYLSFLGIVGHNVFSITNNAIKMDWNPDLSLNDSQK